VENPQGISAMALAEILRGSLSGAPLEEVAAVPADVVYRIFGRELSMGKSMGLMGMVNMVRAAALQQMQATARKRASG
jgi:cysteine desulfuration protein SufE